MIGTMNVTIEILPRTGDRVDALAIVTGPGETSHRFPLSITGTVQAIWNIDDSELNEVLQHIVSEMFSSSIGTDSTPPKEGYWFDSYNSESTIKATLDKMRNLGQKPFLKDLSERDAISEIYGGGILRELERVSGIFYEKTGTRLANALDFSFERTQAEHDLGTAPEDNAQFLYRVCILSVIVDGFGVRLPNEKLDRKYSLQAFENWLAKTLEREAARKATEPFARLKDLRNQYPIHDHFEKDANGQKIVLEKIDAAEKYFGFREHFDYPRKWKQVTDSFKVTIRDIEQIITDYTPSSYDRHSPTTSSLSNTFL